MEKTLTKRDVVLDWVLAIVWLVWIVAAVLMLALEFVTLVEPLRSWSVKWELYGFAPLLMLASALLLVVAVWCLSRARSLLAWSLFVIGVVIGAFGLVSTIDVMGTFLAGGITYPLPEGATGLFMTKLYVCGDASECALTASSVGIVLIWPVVFLAGLFLRNSLRSRRSVSA